MRLSALYATVGTIRCDNGAAASPCPNRIGAAYDENAFNVAVAFGMMDVYSSIMESTDADLTRRLASRLRELRAERGLTLEALAERSGVSRSMKADGARGIEFIGCRELAIAP